MKIPALPYNSARSLAQLRWVDLRSPAEFVHDHVPGAVSVPLFDDAERAVVGTLYHQESKERAYAQGLAFAAAGMPQILSQLLGWPLATVEWRDCFAALSEELRAGQKAVELTPLNLETFTPNPATLALYCWRGGMRSRSVAALLQALAAPVLLLEGGYKDYRRWIRQEMEHLQLPTLIVLRGPTGVGKTKILAQLEQRLPNSTLCLESLAQHRSSVLGAVGKDPVSQPAFESRLCQRLGEMGPGPWFIEGESRKVGDVILPAALYRAMEEGFQWRLKAQTSTRVANLMEDYLEKPGAVDAICARLPFLESRIGPRWVGQLNCWLRAGRAAEVTEVLLERYYDPLYAHSDRRRSWSASFTVEVPSLVDDLLQQRLDGSQ